MTIKRLDVANSYTLSAKIRTWPDYESVYEQMNLVLISWCIWFCYCVVSASFKIVSASFKIVFLHKFSLETLNAEWLVTCWKSRIIFTILHQPDRCIHYETNIFYGAFTLIRWWKSDGSFIMKLKRGNWEKEQNYTDAIVNNNLVDSILCSFPFLHNLIILFYWHVSKMWTISIFVYLSNCYIDYGQPKDCSLSESKHFTDIPRYINEMKKTGSEVSVTVRETNIPQYLGNKYYVF